MNDEQSLHQMKWKLMHSIWQKSFEENVKGICQMFRLKVLEGWEVDDVFGDFQMMIIESVEEMEGYRKEEGLEKENFAVIVIKYAIKQTLEVGMKELGDCDRAIDQLHEKMVDAFCELEEMREKESAFKRFLRKLLIKYRFLFYKLFY